MWSSIQKKVILSSLSSSAPTDSENHHESQSSPSTKKETINNIQATQNKSTTQNQVSNENETPLDHSIFGHPPHLFDEISISTKDSLGGTTIIEPIFDLQQGKNEEKTSKEGGEGLFDTTTSLLDDYNQRFQKNGKDESTEQSVQLSLLLEQEQKGVVGGESIMSYNSLERIEKRAALKSKVEEHRQILTSKLSGLQSLENKTDEDGGLSSAEEEEDLLLDNDDDDLSYDHNDNHDNVMKKRENHNYHDVNEGVYLDLGNLMFNNDNQKYGDESATKNDEGMTGHSNKTSSPIHTKSDVVSIKTIFYFLFIVSIACNAINRFHGMDDVVVEDVTTFDIMDDQRQRSELVSSAINLLLFHLQLNKVHDERTNKLDDGKKYTNILMIIIALVVPLLINSWIIKILSWFKAKNEDINENNGGGGKVIRNTKTKVEKVEHGFTSPPPKKNPLQREVSSLDKKNVFSSRVNTEVVRKDGSIGEVKKTMRFSPEVKRYSPSYYMNRKTVIKEEEVADKEKVMEAAVKME